MVPRTARLLATAAAAAAAAGVPPLAVAWSAQRSPSERIERTAEIAARRSPPRPRAAAAPSAASAADDCAGRRRGGRGGSGVEAPRSDEGLPVRMTDRTRRPTRRGALAAAAASIASAAMGAAAPAPALGLPDPPDFLLPRDRRSDGGVYRPARRSTAYLVDSTIPPTLVPFRASREAAVLKGLGMGSGTSKAPYLQERITLNNMMNKAVFGAARAVGDLARGSPEDRRYGAGYASFVFLGVDYGSVRDAELASGLLADIVRPRARGAETALGLAFAPRSAQGALERYARGEDDEAALVARLASTEVDRAVVQTYLPLLRFAKSKGLTLLALAPETKDVLTVRTEGLQNVDVGRRSEYVADASGFVQLTQDPKFRLYTERSLLKDFVPLSENDSPGDYFAERIMVHEAIATGAAQWAVRRPDSLVAVVAPTPDLRFMGGPNGRVARVCRYLDPENSIVDDDAVTTILLNPSAENTLSKSKFLRLEIGTAPSNIQYQTKVADYLWFSDMPKVNMLPRMMNYA